MHVLVTGAGGFVGRPLLRRLLLEGHRVTALSRRPDPVLPAHPALRVQGGIDLHRPQPGLLAGVDAVVHLAARTHAAAQATDGVLPFVRDNVTTSLRLALVAREVGVRRFVFVSSAKVYGNTSPVGADGLPYRHRESDAACPRDAYGASKLAAELMLAETFAGHDMTLAVLRPPLVIGAGVKGNLATLRRLLERGLPLPLARIDNRRSLVSLDRLTWLLAHLAAGPVPRAGCWNVSDLEFSTPALLRALGAAGGHPAWLLDCPPRLLARSFRWLRWRGLADRLLASLVLDDTRFRADFPDCPPTDADAALRAVWQAEEPSTEGW
jgi:nucleoside-diphosphate-sugar epimerase